MVLFAYENWALVQLSNKLGIPSLLISIFTLKYKIAVQRQTKYDKKICINLLTKEHDLQ